MNSETASYIPIQSAHYDTDGMPIRLGKDSVFNKWYKANEISTLKTKTITTVSLPSHHTPNSTQTEDLDGMGGAGEMAVYIKHLRGWRPEFHP